MKVAGVWINLKCLPTQEVLIKQALKSKEFYQKKDALKLIKQEIKESGLFKRNKNKSKQRSSRPRNSSSKSSNRKEARDSNKG